MYIIYTSMKQYVQYGIRTTVRCHFSLQRRLLDNVSVVLRCQMQHSDLLLKTNAIKTEKLKFTFKENNYTLSHGTLSSQFHTIRTNDRAQSKYYGAVRLMI